tara:strand:+ start:11759 stop:12208 length:450 start_codon:yes stop_codon:yes gene_type:complete
LKYIEAPADIPPSVLRSLFIAGGITGTEDWQKPFIEYLKELNIMVLNPRRKDFPMGDPEAGAEQIEWEHHALSVATAVSFWFPPETLCPISLFELGTFMKQNRPLFVGCHPDYARAFDVQKQVSLYRPEVQVVDTIVALSEQVKTWVDE